MENHSTMGCASISIANAFLNTMNIGSNDLLCVSPSVMYLMYIALSNRIALVYTNNIVCSNEVIFVA